MLLSSLLASSLLTGQPAPFLANPDRQDELADEAPMPQLPPPC
jgi:hypothetical protein